MTDTPTAEPGVVNGSSTPSTLRLLGQFFWDEPARIFATLGTIAFIGGWSVVIYLAVSNGLAVPDTAYRLQVLVTQGASVTLASAVLWGVAFLAWYHHGRMDRTTKR